MQLNQIKKSSINLKGIFRIMILAILVSGCGGGASRPLGIPSTSSSDQHAARDLARDLGPDGSSASDVAQNLQDEMLLILEPEIP